MPAVEPSAVAAPVPTSATGTATITEEELHD